MNRFMLNSVWATSAHDAASLRSPRNFSIRANCASVGFTAKASSNMPTIFSRADPGRLATVWPHRFASATTKGSLSIASAWAGTLEVVRRPRVVNGIGKSYASIIVERKLRRTAR